MKMFSLAFFMIFCFTACSPRVGIGVGGVVASGDGIAATEVYADNESGVHGSVSMGTSIRL